MEKIFVFGRGEYFKNKYESIKKEFEIVGFLDNAVENQIEDEFYHVPVYPPSDVNILPEYNIYCVATDFFSMWHQLKELGVDDKRIKFGVMISPQQMGLEKMVFSRGEKIEARGEYLIYTIENGDSYEVSTLNELKGILRSQMRSKNRDIDVISELSTQPVSNMFGSERGKAVDRYYIEKFLEENTDDIRGTVLEVANDTYTKMFGGSKVKNSIISHVKGWGNRSIKCNFETGEGVQEELADCIICTQTLQYIFDLKSAINNIYKMLKPGGVALITVPGIKPLCEYDNEKWGEFWSFTAKSMEKLCKLVCLPGNYEVFQFGNAKIATAYLYGVCCEDLSNEDFEYQDVQYPFLISARIKKEEDIKNNV